MVHAGREHAHLIEPVLGGVPARFEFRWNDQFNLCLDPDTATDLFSPQQTLVEKHREGALATNATTSHRRRTRGVLADQTGSEQGSKPVFADSTSLSLIHISEPTRPY